MNDNALEVSTILSYLSVGHWVKLIYYGPQMNEVSTIHNYLSVGHWVKEI